MNKKYIAERSRAQYVDLDMQRRDERCMLLSVSVHGVSNVTHSRQNDLPSGRVGTIVIKIDHDLNFYR